MAWKNGRMTTAVIRSKAGQPCRVMYGNNTWESNTKVGATYRLDHNLNYKSDTKVKQ
jgi:alpha-L-fucosidase 2